MKRIAVAVILIASLAPAAAQQKTVSFTLSVDEAQTVMNAVGEKPWKDVNPLMQKMIAQANAQLSPPPAPQPPPSIPAPAAPTESPQ